MNLEIQQVTCGHLEFLFIFCKKLDKFDKFQTIFVKYLRLCGEEPFQGNDEQDLYKKIFKGSYNTTSTNFQNISANAKVTYVFFSGDQVNQVFFLRILSQNF
jgi:hypothetical protein